MSIAEVKLDNVVTISGGGTPSKKKPEYFTGEIPWVSPKDMKTWEITSSIDRITQEAIENSSAKLIDPEAVLLVIRSGVLKHSLPVGINRVPVTVNQDLKALRCGERILPNYLARYLQANASNILTKVRGTTADNIPTESLRQLMIPLPPLSEQKRIAEILDRAEALRAKRRAALALLDELTQSIFLDMFGDPKSNPKGWDAPPMSELFKASPIFGSMIPPVSEKRPWLSLRVGNIQNWKLDLADSKYIDLPAGSVDRHSVLDGDILMARAIASQDHLGKCVVAHPNGEQWAFDSHIMRLRFDTECVEPQYVRHLLMTAGGRLLFLKASRKSTVQYNINTKEISALRIPVPPISLQKGFVNLVNEVAKIRDTLVSASSELDQLFASLQHRAFRGEL